MPQLLYVWFEDTAVIKNWNYLSHDILNEYIVTIDLFQNDVMKHRRSRDKTSLLAKELASVLFTYYLMCKDGKCTSHARPGVRCKRSRVAGSIETADGEVVEGPVLGNVAEVVGKQGRTDQSLVVELGSLLCSRQ